MKSKNWFKGENFSPHSQKSNKMKKIGSDYYDLTFFPDGVKFFKNPVKSRNRGQLSMTTNHDTFLIKIFTVSVTKLAC